MNAHFAETVHFWGKFKPSPAGHADLTSTPVATKDSGRAYSTFKRTLFLSCGEFLARAAEKIESCRARFLAFFFMGM